MNFQSKTFDEDFNLLFYILMFIALIGIIFLAWNKIDAGYISLFMFIGGILVLMLGNIFFKNEKTFGGITKLIRVPLTIDTTVACFFYASGWIIILLLFAFMPQSQAFSINELSVPLFGNQIRQGLQSLSTAEIGNSMPWKLFTIVHSAGTVETWVYNFALIIGVLIMVASLMKMLNPKITDDQLKLWAVPLTLIICMFAFLGSHVLNGSYDVWWKFAVAGAFNLVTNILIYYVGVVLIFVLGLHQALNFVTLVKQEGWIAVLQGHVSWYGIFFAVLWIIILAKIIIDWDKLLKKLTGSRS